MTVLYYEDDLVTLYLGDCLEQTAWLSADVLVTDPPYGFNYRSSRVDALRGTAIQNDSDTAARDAVLTMWGNRAALVFGTWKQDRPANTRTVLVWDKGTGTGMGDLALPWKPNWEEIYVLGSGFRGHRGSGVYSSPDYIVTTRSSKGRRHPNMKPEPLLRALLLKCPPGVIADPFAGSGTTLVAAKALHRRAIGVELEEAYCEITAKRLQQESFDFGEWEA